MPIINYLKFNVISQPDPKNRENIIQQVQLGPHALFSGGVVMDLEISIDIETAQLLREQSIPLPSPVIIKGLFDTGCTITSIDNSIISKLNLKNRGFVQIHTANGSVKSTQHIAGLSFPGTMLKEKSAHLVQAVNLSGQPFQALIGRDLMSSWAITYNGPAGFVSISD